MKVSIFWGLYYIDWLLVKYEYLELLISEKFWSGILNFDEILVFSIIGYKLDYLLPTSL